MINVRRGDFVKCKKWRKEFTKDVKVGLTYEIMKISVDGYVTLKTDSKNGMYSGEHTMGSGFFREFFEPVDNRVTKSKCFGIVDFMKSTSK